MTSPPPSTGIQGAGTVHHVAWASPIDEHERWRERAMDGGAQPTPVIDRFYFRSIYFREPSGVLFEIATLGPGFTADEPLETLGEKLSLPPDYEPLRERIEATVTPITNPRVAAAKSLGRWRSASAARPSFPTWSASRPGEPEGALVLLHGRGTSEADLHPLLDALDPERRLLGLTPGAPLTGIPPGGRHWYVIEEVGRPDERDLRREHGPGRELRRRRCCASAASPGRTP